jgi:hypothetical protein
MIYQHLQLRCRTGSYNSAGLGYKTAAVSRDFMSLPDSTRADLDSAIKEYSSFPDHARRNDRYGENNRGILRIINYNGFLMAIRNFRVYDQCDTMGTVSYVCTLIFSDNDADMIMKRPWLLTYLRYFQLYEDLAARCDLSSAAPVTVDEQYTEMLRYDLNARSAPRHTVTRLINHVYFSRVISCLAHRAYTGLTSGMTALTHPNISSADWENTGGSLIGEEILAEILRLLPDVLKRQFSGVSYWNFSPTHDSFSPSGIGSFLKRPPVDLRLITWDNNDIGTITDNSNNMLIDSKRGVVRNLPADTDNSFGTILWALSDSEELLHDFYSYINGILNKPEMYKPKLLDIAANMFVTSDLSAEKTVMDKLGDTAGNKLLCSDKESFIIQLLPVLSSELKGNEGIAEHTAELADYIAASDTEISSELEAAILAFPELDNRSRLSSSLCSILKKKCFADGSANEKTTAIIADTMRYGFTEADEKLITRAIDKKDSRITSVLCGILADTIKDNKKSPEYMSMIYDMSSTSFSLKLYIMQCFISNKIDCDHSSFLSDIFNSLDNCTSSEKTSAMSILQGILDNTGYSDCTSYFDASFGSVSNEKAADLIANNSELLQPFAKMLMLLSSSERTGAAFNREKAIYSILLFKDTPSADSIEKIISRFDNCEELLITLSFIRSEKGVPIVWENIRDCFDSIATEGKKKTLTELFCHDLSLIDNAVNSFQSNADSKNFESYFIYIVNRVFNKDENTPPVSTILSRLIDRLKSFRSLCDHAHSNRFDELLEKCFFELAACKLLAEQSMLTDEMSFDRGNVLDKINIYIDKTNLDNTTPFIRKIITDMETGGINDYIGSCVVQLADLFTNIKEMPTTSESYKLYTECEKKYGKYGWKSIKDMNQSQLKKMLGYYTSEKSLNIDKAEIFLNNLILTRLRDKKDDSYDYAKVKKDLLSAAQDRMNHQQDRCAMLTVIYCLLTGKEIYNASKLKDKGVLVELAKSNNADLNINNYHNLLACAENYLEKLISLNETNSSDGNASGQKNARETLDSLLKDVRDSKSILAQNMNTAPEFSSTPESPQQPQTPYQNNDASSDDKEYEKRFLLSVSFIVAIIISVILSIIGFVVYNVLIKGHSSISLLNVEFILSIIKLVIAAAILIFIVLKKKIGDGNK